MLTFTAVGGRSAILEFQLLLVLQREIFPTPSEMKEHIQETKEPSTLKQGLEITFQPRNSAQVWAAKGQRGDKCLTGVSFRSPGNIGVACENTEGQRWQTSDPVAGWKTTCLLSCVSLSEKKKVIRKERQCSRLEAGDDKISQNIVLR